MWNNWGWEVDGFQNYVIEIDKTKIDMEERKKKSKNVWISQIANSLYAALQNLQTD